MLDALAAIEKWHLELGESLHDLPQDEIIEMIEEHLEDNE